MEGKEKKGLSKSLLLIILGVVFIVAGILSDLFLGGKAKVHDKDKEDKQTVTEQSEKVTPLMYEITKDGSENKIYLFGSIHVGRISKLEFPDYVKNAYDNSSYLAFEYDISASQSNPDSQEKTLAAMQYSDGTTIKDHIDEEFYNQLVDFFEEKKLGNISQYEGFNLFGLSQLLTAMIIPQTGLSANDGVDIYFINKAKDDNKTILEVESEDFQMNLLSSFPERLYEIQIKDTIENYDEGIEAIKELYDAWKQGNPEKIHELDDTMPSEEEKEKYSESDLAIMADYQNKILTQRNIGMADKFEEYFNNDYDTLFIVGAAHLVGDDGLAALLEARGYTVVQLNK